MTIDFTVLVIFGHNEQVVLKTTMALKGNPNRESQRPVIISCKVFSKALTST